MPRFYFHGEDGECFADPAGTELTDVAAAKRHAVDVLVEMLKGQPHKFWDTENFKIIVTDDNKLVLFELYLGVTRAPAMRLSEPNKDRATPGGIENS